MRLSSMPTAATENWCGKMANDDRLCVAPTATTMEFKRGISHNKIRKVIARTNLIISATVKLLDHAFIL
jgi:hypothetical protein